MDPLQPGWKTSEAHSALLAMLLAFTGANMDMGPQFATALAACPPLVQVATTLGIKLAGIILPAVTAQLYGRERRRLKSVAVQAGPAVTQ